MDNIKICNNIMPSQLVLKAGLRAGMKLNDVFDVP
jgi:hypothetical protein